jgi:TolA-binding protein
MANDQGWETYSKLVLQQLETLNSGIESMRVELQLVKEQITKIKAKEDRLEELKAWKDKVDEVASPSQMKYAFRELENLKHLKQKLLQFLWLFNLPWQLRFISMNFI